VVAPVDEIRSSDIAPQCFSVKIARDQADDQKSNKPSFSISDDFYLNFDFKYVKAVFRQ